MIRTACSALVFFSSLLLTAPTHAHFWTPWGHGSGSEVDYNCKPHHHGRFLHRCSDEVHPRMDESHQHSGLPTYYARKPDFYLGAKLGAFNVSNSAFDVDGTPSAMLIGYGTHKLSVEAELSRAIVRLRDYNGFELYSPDSGQYDTLALFGVHRFGGDIYGKVKIGFRKNWANTDAGRAIDEDFTMGVGIGKSLRRFTLEGEYTILESNVDFYSVGINYKF